MTGTNDVAEGNELKAVVASKPSAYFAAARREVLRVLPPRCERVLELGCGTGATITMIRGLRDVRYLAGMELSAAAAAVAREQGIEVVVGDIEAIEIPRDARDLDVILCLDVLEHLRDPWTVVRRLSERLRVGGVIITSIPNVRHARVVLPLLLFGEWRYTTSGLLDDTHLRFFTRKTAIELFEQAGLTVDRVESLGRDRGKSRVVNLLTLGVFRRFLDFQYLLRAERRS